LRTENLELSLKTVGFGIIFLMLFRFKAFPVYNTAKDFRKNIRDIVKEKFPPEQRYLLSDQILRAADSICLHIAEGSNRSTDKDFAHFLNGALTSLEETVCCLDLALDDRYIKIEDYKRLEAKAENLGKQLIGFQNKLRT